MLVAPAGSSTSPTYHLACVGIPLLACQERAFLGDSIETTEDATNKIFEALNAVQRALEKRSDSVEFMAEWNDYKFNLTASCFAHRQVFQLTGDKRLDCSEAGLTAKPKTIKLRNWNDWWTLTQYMSNKQELTRAITVAGNKLHKGMRLARNDLDMYPDHVRTAEDPHVARQLVNEEEIIDGWGKGWKKKRSGVFRQSDSASTYAWRPWQLRSENPAWPVEVTMFPGEYYESETMSLDEVSKLVDRQGSRYLPLPGSPARYDAFKYIMRQCVANWEAPIEDYLNSLSQRWEDVVSQEVRKVCRVRQKLCDKVVLKLGELVQECKKDCRERALQLLKQELELEPATVFIDELSGKFSMFQHLLRQELGLAPTTGALKGRLPRLRKLGLKTSALEKVRVDSPHLDDDIWCMAVTSSYTKASESNSEYHAS